MTKRRVERFVWLGAAGLVTVVAILLALTGQGSCDPATGACRTEPLLGVGGTWVLLAASTVFVMVAVSRATRR